MLLRFTVTNFASIRDELELTAVAEDDHSDLAVRPIPRSGLSALPVVGVYGPNASGKSNIAKALFFMQNAVLNSHQRWLPSQEIPRNPFLLAPDPESAPSEFIAEFVAEDVRYEYGFACDSQAFLEEWLTSYPEGRPRRIFHRTAGQPIVFGPSVRGPKKQVESVMRANSLFLSAAAANNFTELAPMFSWFAATLRIAFDENFEGRLRETRHWLENHGAPPVLNLLRYADLGVTNVRFADVNLPAEQALKLAEVIGALSGESHDSAPADLRLPLDVEVAHQVGGHEFTLPLEFESSGTKTWLGIAGPVVSTLSTGSVLVIDELDARLHPTLSAQVVRLFQDPRTNPKRAQLVFNTHDASLLGPDLPFRLRRDQAWITEKVDGATRVRPFSDYKARATDNLEKRYLAGRYGGLPFLDEELLTEIIDEVGA
jgi:hypothetical protein